jgi:hypothetical protein
MKKRVQFVVSPINRKMAQRHQFPIIRQLGSEPEEIASNGDQKIRGLWCKYN